MKLLKLFARKVRQFLLAPLLENEGRGTDVPQIHLQQWYSHLARTKAPLPSLRDVGFSVYSESDEDGCLLFIFAVIGCTHRKLVDLCAGHGMGGSNTANLLINHRWLGLLLDGNESLVAKGRQFYQAHPQTRSLPPIFVRSWITRDTVNQLFEEHGFSGEIDLLSLDMDGVDYWILEALTVQPRVIVLEYNTHLGPNRSVTVPYSDDFYAHHNSPPGVTPIYLGASLTAFVKLAKRKGYRLVGCNHYGFNAFFIRQGLAEAEIPEVAVADCFPNKNLAECEATFRTIAHRPWVEV